MSEFIEISAKTKEEALTQALVKLETTSDNIEYEVIDKGSSGLFGFIGSKPMVIRVWKKEGPADIVKEAKDFTDRLFKAMGEDVTSEIHMNEEDGSMNIEFSGPDMGLLIGKRGQTLDSIQYLISLVVNKKSDSYVRVRVDTENYRERRKATLENLAKNIAFKVKRSRHSVVLEPMNPYERRIIHSALQGDKYVETHSEGDEPYRKIVVTLKKEYRDRAPRSSYGRNSGSYGNRQGNRGKGGYHSRYDRRGGKGFGKEESYKESSSYNEYNGSEESYNESFKENNRKEESYWEEKFQDVLAIRQDSEQLVMASSSSFEEKAAEAVSAQDFSSEE